MGDLLLTFDSLLTRSFATLGEPLFAAQKEARAQNATCFESILAITKKRWAPQPTAISY
jgi:hypothetical protein